MWVEQRNDKFRAYERYTDAHGVTHRVSVPMDRNTPAERKKASAALLERVTVLSKDTERMNLRMIVDSYLEQQKKEVKLSTYHRNKASLDRLVPIIGNVPADEITAGLIRSNILKYTDNPTTFNEYIKRVKAMLRWAYQNDYIQSPDCFAKLRNLKDSTEREKVQNKYLEKDELNALIDGMDVPLWALVTRFLALSGLRVGEFIALNMDDVDFKAKQIHVTKTYNYKDGIITTPKTLDSKRDVHMQAALLSVAKEIQKETTRFKMITGFRNDYFVMGRRGERMQYDAFNKYLRENAMRILDRKISTHILRHTHVALMAAKGVPLEVLSRRLGHGSSKITRDIYFHITKDLQTSDANLIDAIASDL